MMRLAAMFALAFAMVPCVASSRTAIGSPATDATKQAAFESVLLHTSEILGIPKERIAVNQAFANQSVPGDDLDIVEIVMAVEDELAISIDDSSLESAAGASGLIADRLTVRQLQEVVAKLLALKPNNSFKPKPLRGSA